jgi:hypothetical protein
MSYFTTPSHAPTVHSWPSNLKNAILLYCGKEMDCEDHKFPSNLEGLAEFGEVTEDPDVQNPLRNKCFVHKPLADNTSDDICTVPCWLHGFLKQFQLSTFGNWDG